IGTNKPDAVETVQCMIEDLENGVHFNPSNEDVAAFVHERQPDVFSYEDWLALNEIETAKGEAAGRPRVKFTTIPEMIEAIRS
ncbi:MAG: NADP oxidoreductase, partial [Rhodothermales bacterium]